MLKAGKKPILVFMSDLTVCIFIPSSFRRTLKAIKRMSWTIWTLLVTRANTHPVNRIKVPLWIVLSVHPPQPHRKTPIPRFQRILTRKWTSRVTKATLTLDDGHRWRCVQTDRTFKCSATDKLENYGREKEYRSSSALRLFGVLAN